MTEAPYTSFAIAGAGPHIGIPIVKAFLALSIPILVIARPTSNLSALPDPSSNPHLKIVRADYADVTALTALLRAHGTEVLISGVSFFSGGVRAQNGLADAAKAAGVGLFVPSEYGTPTRGEKGVVLAKDEFAKYLTAIGVPWLRLYCGLFHEFVPWVAAVEETGKFLIVGKGNTPISFTSIPEVAAYLAHVLTTVPRARLSNIELRIEGQRASLSELGELYTASTALKTPVLVEHVDALPLPVGDNRGYLQAKFALGAGSSGWDCVEERDNEALARSGNALWEGHRWEGVKEVLRL